MDGIGIHVDESSQRCVFVEGDSNSIQGQILKKASILTRRNDGKIQMLIITGSRERAFCLFSCICRIFKRSSVICHSAVGSIKFERDLKALHYGVDILIVTPGRLSRLYNRNENCFDQIESCVLDESEILFTRAMIARWTKESITLFPVKLWTIYYNDASQTPNLSSADFIKSYLSQKLSFIISDSIQLPAVDNTEKPVVLLTNICSSYYIIKPVDSLAISRRVPYILNCIRSYRSNNACPLIVISSFSEYNINFLLSYLIETKSVNTHILCLSECNIHKEIRSRMKFIQEITESNKTCETPTRLVLILHDCLLPIFCQFSHFDILIHMDLPLTALTFLQRMSLLTVDDSCYPNSMFFISSDQEAVLKLLYSKCNAELTQHTEEIDVKKERVAVEKLLLSKNKRQIDHVDDVNVDTLTEQEAHMLFYKNKEAEIVSGDTEEYHDIIIDDLDLSELDNIEEETETNDICETEEEICPCQEREYVSTFYTGWESVVPMVPVTPVKSIFNPFYDPITVAINAQNNYVMNNSVFL